MWSTTDKIAVSLKTHGSLPISDEYISFSKTSECISCLLHCSASSHSWGLIAFTDGGGKLLLNSQQIQPPLERERTSALRDKGTFFTGGHARQWEGMIDVSPARSAFLHFQELGLCLSCLHSSLQSPDLNHSAHLARKPMTVAQGQAVSWDAVGTYSKFVSCCLLPFSWATSASFF